MDAYLCPKGHHSQDADYCSECGAKIALGNPPLSGQNAESPAASRSHSSGGPKAVEHCPSCGSPRDTPAIAFCEICGWDFANGPASGSAPAPSPEAPSAPAPPPTPVQTAAAAPSDSWSVVVSVDPLLARPGSPPPPEGIVPQTVSLTQPVTLIGRRSDVRAIYPEIALQYDDAVSHRHALLQLDPQGALLLRDIGAANGTVLNGREVQPMIDQPLHDGDQITLGYWSRIAVKQAAEKPKPVAPPVSNS